MTAAALRVRTSSGARSLCALLLLPADVGAAGRLHAGAALALPVDRTITAAASVEAAADNYIEAVAPVSHREHHAPPAVGAMRGHGRPLPWCSPHTMQVCGSSAATDRWTRCWSRYSRSSVKYRSCVISGSCSSS